MKNNMNAKFGIVIVTFNRIELLKVCLKHVFEQTEHYDEIVIINNCSTDGTLEYLDLLEHSHLNVVNMKKNVGGAGGYARGTIEIKKLGCDWITLIDDDAILNIDYLENLKKWQAHHEDIGAMTGVVKTEDQIQYFFARRWIENLKNGMKYEWAVPRSEYDKDFFTCDLVSFCGITFRTDILEKIGIPNRYYFINRDDTEYSMRIRKITNIAVVTKAVIDHRTKKVNKGPDWKLYYAIRNQILMLRKHYGIYISLIQTKEDVKRYFSYVRSVPNNIARKKMIKAGIIHAWTGRLGKNTKYLPGKE